MTNTVKQFSSYQAHQPILSKLTLRKHLLVNQKGKSRVVGRNKQSGRLESPLKVLRFGTTLRPLVNSIQSFDIKVIKCEKANLDEGKPLLTLRSANAIDNQVQQNYKCSCDKTHSPK